jgi:hypothetical protein
VRNHPRVGHRCNVATACAASRSRLTTPDIGRRALVECRGERGIVRIDRLVSATAASLRRGSEARANQPSAARYSDCGGPHPRTSALQLVPVLPA